MAERTLPRYVDGAPIVVGQAAHATGYGECYEGRVTEVDALRVEIEVLTSDEPCRIGIAVDGHDFERLT